MPPPLQPAPSHRVRVLRPHDPPPHLQVTHRALQLEFGFLPAWPPAGASHGASSAVTPGAGQPEVACWPSLAAALDALPCMVAVLALLQVDGGGGSGLPAAVSTCHRGVLALAGIVQLLHATLAHLHGHGVQTTAALDRTSDGRVFPSFDAAAAAAVHHFPPPITERAPARSTSSAAHVFWSERRRAALGLVAEDGASRGGSNAEWLRFARVVAGGWHGATPLRAMLAAAVAAMRHVLHAQAAMVRHVGTMAPSLVPPALRRAAEQAHLALHPSDASAVQRWLADADLGSRMQRSAWAQNLAHALRAAGDVPSAAVLDAAALTARLRGIDAACAAGDSGTTVSDGLRSCLRAFSVLLGAPRAACPHVAHAWPAVWRWLARLLLVTGDARSAFVTLQRAASAVPWSAAVRHDVWRHLRGHLLPGDAEALV
jgi:hypothetical protein